MALVRDARNGPMCPRSVVPFHDDPAHAAVDRLRDAYLAAFLIAFDTDDPGKLPDWVDAAIATANEAAANRMRLYRASDTVGAQRDVVEAWWWQCLICGHTITASPAGIGIAREEGHRG